MSSFVALIENLSFIYQKEKLPLPSFFHPLLFYWSERLPSFSFRFNFQGTVLQIFFVRFLVLAYLWNIKIEGVLYYYLKSDKRTELKQESVHSRVLTYPFLMLPRPHKIELLFKRIFHRLHPGSQYRIIQVCTFIHDIHKGENHTVSGWLSYRRQHPTALTLFRMGMTSTSLPSSNLSEFQYDGKWYFPLRYRWLLIF